MGGLGPAFTMWDKTRGAQKVRGIMPLSSSPVMLVGVDPRIQTLRDFRDGDKIGVSAIKVTDQAITLQMAAAKEWGWDQRFRLDPLTVSISNPDGMIGMLSGQSEVKNHAAIIPFSVAGSGIRQGASGDDVGSITRTRASGSVMSTQRAVPRSESEAVRRGGAAFEDAIALSRRTHISRRKFTWRRNRRSTAWSGSRR